MTTGDRHSDYQALVAAWRTASDQRVSEALIQLEDLVDEAREIVQQEAERRGLGPALIDSSSSCPEFILRTGVTHSFRFVLQHRFVFAVLFAVGFRFISVLLSRYFPENAITIWIITNITHLGSLGALCWPLTSYRIACLIALLGSISMMASGTTFNLILGQFDPAFNWNALFLAFLTVSIVAWLFTWALFSSVIFIRRRYWPVYQEGQCVKCGYDLRGLVEPRCPECGTAFDTPIPEPVDERAMTT